EHMGRELLEDADTQRRTVTPTLDGRGQEDKLTTPPAHPFGVREPTTGSHPLTLSHLNRYALVLAQAKEYVRASQTRLLLQPVAAHLEDRLGSTGAEQRLRWLLVLLRRVMPRTPGYAAANLLHLALQLGSDLQGYDFSGLTVRQADLRQAQLRNVNFA